MEHVTDHIQNAILNHELVSDSTLHVIVPISNPARFHSRYRLFREFAQAMRATANVQMHVVELAFGDRHHEVTGRASGVDGASELQLRSSHELWHKENMINLGVRHLLPRDWKYVAWVDGDVFFQSPNWALETMHQLQHFPVVQPWSECIDGGPHGNAIAMHTSFCSLIRRGKRIQAHSGEPYQYGHSGFAWACTRQFWENVGGLMEFPILGSADHHMAWAMINRVGVTIHDGMTQAFRRRCEEWQTRAFRESMGHLGYVPGVLHHRWHGKKSNRRYRERWQILVDNHYDPDTDLRRDHQGLLYLVNKPRLADEIRRYMRVRQEDGIDED